MRLGDVVEWLLDMPADGWRVLAGVAQIYRDGDDDLKEALRSQVHLLVRLLTRRAGTPGHGLCYDPRCPSISLLLMPHGRSLHVMTVHTTRVHVVDPDPTRRPE